MNPYYIENTDYGTRWGIVRRRDGEPLASSTDPDEITNMTAVLNALYMSNQSAALRAAEQSAQWVIDRQAQFKKMYHQPHMTPAETRCGQCANSAKHLVHPKCGLCDGKSHFVQETPCAN